MFLDMQFFDPLCIYIFLLIIIVVLVNKLYNSRCYHSNLVKKINSLSLTKI